MALIQADPTPQFLWPTYKQTTRLEQAYGTYTSRPNSSIPVAHIQADPTLEYLMAHIQADHTPQFLWHTSIQADPYT